ncbi:MAG: hypothetical protein ABEH35_08390 [Haloarculaceae archaeon]
MDLDRVAKFGAVGAGGVVLISLGTVGGGWVAWTNRTAGAEASAVGTVAIVAIAGTTAAILYLFLVIGAFVDRELAARGLDAPED